MNDQTDTAVQTVTETDRKTKLVVHDDTQFAVYLDTARFEHAYRVANVLASSTMIPKHFQGQPGNCLIALNLAARLKVDPMLVMWKMPIVHDKPGMEGQLVIALVNAMKPFKTGVRFDIQGSDDKPESMSCLAWAITKDGDRIEYPLTWSAARKVGNASKNDNWIKIPRLMLMYRSATYLVRGFAPEVLMGLYTKEELDDGLIDVTPPPSSARAIEDELKKEVQDEKQSHDAVTGEIIENAQTASDAPNLQDWLNEIAAAPTAALVDHRYAVASDQFLTDHNSMAALTLAKTQRKQQLAQPKSEPKPEAAGSGKKLFEKPKPEGAAA
jgi:hypothetical protein